MKKKIIVCLIFSLVLNVLLGIFSIGSIINTKDKNSEILSLKEENSSKTKLIDEYNKSEEMNKLITNVTIKNNLVEFFKAQYNFDNNNYVSRFEEVKKYVSSDVLDALKGSGELHAPTANIENKITDINIYLTTDNDMKKVKSLVNLSTEYSVDSITSPSINQIFEVELENKDSEWTITKYTLLGDYNSYSSVISKS